MRMKKGSRHRPMGSNSNDKGEEQDYQIKSLVL